ncbi:type I polyketide synthase [Sorangium sp. So ce726]|uniref:type I polyketide synthase n=1 Tax=Sorangium sp. So ce726 TaxID=3133319 RepID=UPI003F63BFED
MSEDHLHSPEPSPAPADDSLDIAVVGMSCRLPGARGVDDFWGVLREGVECIRRFSDEELLALGVPREALAAEGFVPAGAVLEEVDRFDAAFFGYSPREAELMDPQHRLFLECAWEALERAACVPDAARTVGVFAGTGLSTYLLYNLASRPELFDADDSFQIMIGNDKDFLATRLSYLLDLRGPSVTVQTGCSTSLVAVHLACQALLGYQCDVAIAGGAAVQVPQRTGYRYQPEGIASPDGHCRPFDADAGGTIFGSGVGVVVLKRLSDALADGDPIHAVIKGSAINNDGSAKLGYTAPSVEGQIEVITRAQSIAGVSPDSIGFVEAHGTATALGDPVEVEALTRVFRAATEATKFCALGSVKSNIGHTDAAAGVSGLIKAVLAVEHGELPPTLHFQQPNPRFDWQESPFFVNAAPQAWGRAAGGTPRRAGVSSFGIGGTNAHVVLEEAPPRPPSGPSRPHQLLVLSAKTRAALDRATADLARHLEQRPELPLADVASTLQLGRRALPHRRAVVCSDAADAARALAELPPQRSAAGEARSRQVVFMFPGGGAQHPGMGAWLYEHEPIFRQHLDTCGDLLAPRLGVHLRDVIYPRHAPGADGGGAGGRLTRTGVALPALFAVEYALARLWMEWGVEPAAMIGHSMGEYVAACLAGVFSLKDALDLVAERGRLFEGAPRGAMLSVELPEPELRKLCSDRLSIAAVNGPEQGVMSGDEAAIEELAAALEQRGVEVRRVHIDVAAHSHLIDGIMPAFAAFLRTLRLGAPARPFVSGVTGTWITESDATSVDYWVRHLRQTVRFGDGVRTLLEEEPGRVLLEVGPGRVLSSLARLQVAPDAATVVLTSMRAPVEERPDTEVLLTTLGRLWVSGVKVDFARASAHEQRRRVALPTYPWERRRFWIDPRPAGAGRPEAARAETERRALADWFYLPSWRRAAAPAPAVPAGARFLVFADPGGAGPQIASRLAARGHDVTTVVPGVELRRVDDSSYELDPAREDAFAALLAELERAGRRPDRIVYAWPLLEPLAGADPVEHARRLGLDALIALGKAVGAAASGARPLHVSVIGSGVEAVSERDAVRPERALVLGPCRVLPLEQPNVTCALVDIASAALSEPELDRLAAEAEGPAESAVVALRGARRLVQAFDPVRLDPPASPPLRPRGTYLITGGLGGVGLVLAEHLARRAEARLALLGRAEIPGRDAWPAWLAGHAEDDPTSARIRRLQALEALGAEVLVLRADVADPAQVARALGQVQERFGALHGVIHAAGVPAGGLIQVKDRDAVEAVLRPKVQGTLVLDRLLAGAPLDFFVLCSSRTAATGDLGQVDHVAANAFQEAFAERCAQEGRAGVIALAWDTWAEVGQAVTTAVSGALEGVRAQLLAHAIRPAEGPEVLERALSRPAARIVVSTRAIEVAAAESRRVARELMTALGVTDEPAEGAAPRPLPASGDAEHVMARIWERVLRVERVGPHDSFFDLGGNSVLGLRLIAEIKREFGLSLPAVSLFENPTVTALTRRVAGNSEPDDANEDRRSRGARRRERHQRRQEAK